MAAHVFSMAKSRTNQPLVRAYGGVLKLLRARFEHQRGRPYSGEQISRLVQKTLDVYGPGLSFSEATLSRWEGGQVANPELPLLRALAEVYGVNLYTLILVLLANRDNPTLTDADAGRLLEDIHAASASEAGRQQSTPPYPLVGTSANEVAARLFTLAEYLAELAESIVFAAAGGQTPTPRHPAAQRPSHPRKPRGTTARGA